MTVNWLKPDKLLIQNNHIDLAIQGIEILIPIENRNRSFKNLFLKACYRKITNKTKILQYLEKKIDWNSWAGLNYFEDDNISYFTSNVLKGLIVSKDKINLKWILELHEVVFKQSKCDISKGRRDLIYLVKDYITSDQPYILKIVK